MHQVVLLASLIHLVCGIFFSAGEEVEWRGGWGHFSARLCVQHQGKIPEFNQEVDR